MIAHFASRFQEIVPLTAGNVLVVEDNEPASRWLAIIHQALNEPQEQPDDDDDPPPPRPFDTLPSPVVTDDRNDELAPDTLNPESLDIQESSTHLTTLESPPLLTVVASGDAKMKSNRAAQTRSRNTKGEGGWRRPGRNWAGASAVDLF